MLTTTLIVLSSCGEQAYYDDVYSFEDEQWDKTDTAVFKVPDVVEVIEHKPTAVLFAAVFLHKARVPTAVLPSDVVLQRKVS